MRPPPLLLVLAACAGAPTPGGPGATDDTARTEDEGHGGDGAPDDTDDTGADTATGPDLPDTDHCWILDDYTPVYVTTVETWRAQDDLAEGPADPLVFVGSSSIRRWEDLARSYRDHRPVQRGFGGAQLGDIAWFADDLVNRHDPRAVVVFAGTNDVAFGVSADDVVARFRCLRERLWIAHGRALPVFFIGITPTPSRWSTWETANAVNEAVAALAADDPGLVYVDVPAAFLATGQPPDADLFVGDQLHLSASGYALWDSILRQEVDAVLPPLPRATRAADHPPAGGRLLVDLGPSNAEDGEPTPSPDYLGQHWNNWYDIDGGAVLLPGEHLDGLVTADGAATSIDLVLTGGFTANGRANGGLLWPSVDLLGDLAVGSATGDYFYSVSEDLTGGFFLRGLDPDATYALRLFASREADETRLSTYTVDGAETVSATLQTSGPGAGTTGNGNDDDIVTFTGLAPDDRGQLFVDVTLAQGSYAYVSAFELTVEGGEGEPPPSRTGPAPRGPGCR